MPLVLLNVEYRRVFGPRGGRAVGKILNCIPRYTHANAFFQMAKAIQTLEYQRRGSREGELRVDAFKLEVRQTLR